MIRTLTGRGVLLWLAGFFAVIFAVNVGFIVVSVDTFRGEDEQKPYLQGIEYNQTLARRAVQARLGWTADVTAERAPTGKVRVVVALRDRSGAPQDRATLAAQLRHPADENRDRELRLTEIGPGRYLADAGNISAGAWDIVISNGAADAPFEASARLWVP